MEMGGMATGDNVTVLTRFDDNNCYQVIPS